MRKLLLIVGILFLASPVMAQEIVIFDSFAGDFGGIEAARLAAAMIGGASVAAYAAGEEAQWIADVNDGADIVVFDVCSNYIASVPSALLSSQLDAMHAWHLGNPNGCGILSVWFMSIEPHPIFAYYGVQLCSDFFNVIPLYQWSPDPVWTGVPNPVQQFTDIFTIDGHRVVPIGGAQAIGGFSLAAQNCEAGLVTHHNRHTWFIGETGNGGDVDADSDGVYDWVEMYANIFGQCPSGPIAIETETWGSIKSLYR